MSAETPMTDAELLMLREHLRLGFKLYNLATVEKLLARYDTDLARVEVDRNKLAADLHLVVATHDEELATALASAQRMRAALESLFPGGTFLMRDVTVDEVLRISPILDAARRVLLATPPSAAGASEPVQFTEVETTGRDGTVHRSTVALWPPPAGPALGALAIEAAKLLTVVFPNETVRRCSVCRHYLWCGEGDCDGCDVCRLMRAFFPTPAALPPTEATHG